jgi:RHS repeat-associated protein
MQGQYMEVETGLCYNTFRYYDPDIGRFISEDPIGLLGGTNLYSFAPNTDGWIDPWGWATSKPCDNNISRTKKAAGSYRPNRTLPRDKHGNPVPDADVPHTQLGTKSGRNGDYTQAREWGYDSNGRLVLKRDIDFTDHGRPQNHPNPHQHEWLPTGGTPKHGPAKPLERP